MKKNMTIGIYFAGTICFLMACGESSLDECRAHVESNSSMYSDSVTVRFEEEITTEEEARYVIADYDEYEMGWVSEGPQVKAWVGIPEGELCEALAELPQDPRIDVVYPIIIAQVE